MRRSLLASREELAALRQRVAQPVFEPIYQALLRRCDLILESAPVLERQWRVVAMEGRPDAAVLAARTTQGRIFDLTIAHCIEPNAAYLARAIEELRNLTSWSTWLSPTHASLKADLATAEAAVGAVVGLDWLWDDLTPALRQQMIDAILAKAIRPYLAGVQQRSWWYDCYHHWNAVINSGCGLAALALADEHHPAVAAGRAVDPGLQTFFAALGSDGGWDEGPAGWGYALRYLLLLARARLRLDGDDSIFQQRGMDATGRFGVYFNPHGHSTGFGQPAVPLYGTLYILTDRYEQPELLWWLDRYAFHRDVSTSGISAAGLSLLMRPDKHAPAKPALAPAVSYEQIGWAALADAWPSPSLYVAVKAGDLSAYNSHHDMNAVNIQVDGELLVAPNLENVDLQTAGDDFYDVQARAHNTAVVSQRDHRIDMQGRVMPAFVTAQRRWVWADAGRALGESTQFHRHVIIIAGRAQTPSIAFIVDEIRNGQPEPIELFWHLRGRATFDSASLIGSVAGKTADVHFALAATADIAATLHSRQLANQTDRLVHAATGPVDRAVIVTAFSPAPVKELSVTEDDRGIAVNLGTRSIRLTGRMGSRKLADSAAKVAQ